MRVLVTDQTLFDRDRKPIPFGRFLLESFGSSWVLVATRDEERTTLDLALHGFPQECEVISLSDDEEWIEGIRRIRQSSTSFDVLVDTDPNTVAWAYGSGISSLLALDPKFLDPRFRPDGRGKVAWSHLVDEIESQARLLADKRRAWDKEALDQWE